MPSYGPARVTDDRRTDRQTDRITTPKTAHSIASSRGKIDCTDTFIKNMSDVFAVLLQNAFEITSPFTDAWRLRDFPLSLHIRPKSRKRNTKFPAVRADRGVTAQSCVSTHCCRRFYSATWLDCQRLVLLNILCWNSGSSRQKRSSGCWLSPGVATLRYEFHEAE